MAESNPLKLFVNYRRADEPVFVELMRTWFLHRYGRENVFMDFDTIPPFAKFEEFIRHKVRESDAVVAVIGPRWLEIMQEKTTMGKPDYVRIELEEALQHGKVIAPVCIQGARVPADHEIPISLRPIFQRNVAELRAGRDIINNIGWLMDALENALIEQGIQRDLAQPVSTTPTPQQAPARSFDVHAAIGHFYEANEAHDWPSALLWLAQIRESNAPVPGFFKLDQREADIRAVLKHEEEELRLHQTADYLYGFVRLMVRYGDTMGIHEALEEVWSVLPSYDPEGFAMVIPKAVHPKMTSSQTPTPQTVPKLGLSAVVRHWISDPFEWITIPAGKVTLEVRGGYNLPRAKKVLYTIEGFEIAKYPVTNQQYLAFIEAKDGYRDTQWWDYSADATAWRNEKAKPDDTAFEGNDLPRTNVNWYDAVAFCNWLKYKTSQEIVLPTEQQWQRAAQGNTGWRYPWGNEFDATCCNFDTKGPSPVTRFPKGASPYGVMDMSGNVWEWCLTQWGTDSTDIIGDNARVLRGGAWRYDNEDVLCTVERGANNPYQGFDDAGFRLVRSQ